MRVCGVSRWGLAQILYLKMDMFGSVSEIFCWPKTEQSISSSQVVDLCRVCVVKIK